MSFSDWLSNLRNRIPAASPRRRNNNRSNSVALQTALKRSTESLEDRTLLSGNSLVVQLPPGGGTSELLVNNDDLVVRDPGGNELLRVPDGQLGLLTIQGTDASDDTLRIDIGPNTQTDIHFDGGVGGFDTLVSVGEVPDQFQYDATGFQAGSFRDLITFSNLEPTDFTATPLIDVTVNIDAMDMLPGTTVTTTISVDGGNPAHTLISFDNGLESFLFNTLSGTLTINGDALDADNIIVEGFGTGFTGNLVIDGQGGGTDTVNLNGAVTFAANQSLTVNATTINAPNATSNIATSGTGAINLTATSNIALGSGSSLTTVNGGVALIANSAGTATGIFTGINVDNATIQTTGTGAISLDGHGTDSGGANSNLNGILLQNGATISSTATGATAGTITIDGTGGDGTTLNHGVLLDGSSNVTSVDGAISITGDGGAGNANFNIGAVILGAVTSTGTGANAATITVDGTGGGGANNNYGVSIEGASADITSVAGAVQILGTGGTGGNFHHAVNLQGDGSVQVASAPLTVTGTATTGDSIGVRLSEQSGGQLVSVGSGTITVNATAAGSLADFIAGSDSIIGDATHAGAGTAATGSININADTIDWSGSLSVESDGALTIQPRTASTTIGVGGGVGTLNLDDIELGFLQDGFSSITIGDETNGTGAVDVDAFAFVDPISIYGGATTVTGLQAGVNNVTVQAREGDLTVADNGITTTTGNIVLSTVTSGSIENSTSTNGTGNAVTSGGSITLNSDAGIGIVRNFFDVDTAGGAVIVNGTGSSALKVDYEPSDPDDVALTVNHTGDGNAIFRTDASGTLTVESATLNGGDFSVILFAAPTPGTLAVDGTISTIGTGAVSLTTPRNILLNSGSSVTTVNGGITLDANSSGTTAGNFVGLDISGGTVTTTGSGAISLTGRGAVNSENNSSQYGVNVHSGATIQSTATGPSAGTISIIGFGGDGTLTNWGGRIFDVGTGTTVSSVDGDISIAGTGGNIGGTSNNDHGVAIAAPISSTGITSEAALITISGTAANSTTFNRGISMSAGTLISSVEGDITLTGTGAGSNGGALNSGVELSQTGVIQTANGTLTVSGMAGAGDSSGVRLGNSSGNLLLTGAGSIVVNADSNVGTAADLFTQSSSTIGGGSASGSITINANSIALTDTTSIQTTGSLTIQPRTVSATIGLGGGAGTLNLDDTELSFLQDGFSSITIGDATSGNIDVDTAAFNDPVTLVTGGEIHDAAAGTDIDAGTDSVTLDGTIAPGQLPGILTVSGNFAFADDSTYEVEIGGTGGAGVNPGDTIRST